MRRATDAVRFATENGIRVAFFGVDGSRADLEFLRRIYLDSTGRLPEPDAIRRFVKDDDPAKRDKYIDRLVDSTDYADYFADKWSALLRNKRVQASVPPAV